MKCEKLLEDIKRLSDEDIYNKFIIGGEIWYFKMRFDNQWYRYYDEFKLFISKKLEVHYNDIAVAGSAKLGFSINPNKKLKAFDNSSDIDIVIISRKYFYMFWDAYIQDSYSEIKINNFNKIHFSIFRKYIDLEGFSKKNET